MTYATFNSVVGVPPAQLSGLVVETVPRFPVGLLLGMTDPWWGFGEFIYARASAAIAAFNLVTILPVFDAALSTYRYDCVPAPVTANLGRGVAVAMKGMAAGDYGWFQVSGIVPVSCTASIAADSSFGTAAAAGQGAAVAAGKQILNARIVAPATTTVAKTSAVGANGSNTITVQNTDGLFVGAYLSGTGVGAAAIITGIDSSNRVITVSVVNSAAVTGTVTATYNNATIFYNVASLNRSFLQGAIT